MRNVVAVLPGSDPTGRLFLMAHHDSVETGPGASDDAAGVSTLLETVRALSQGPQLRNDVVVVLTDAEEACLCGAEAFASSHPLASDGGVVLNVEARGTTGPPIMFETSRGNADLAGGLRRRRAAPGGQQLRRRGLPGPAQRHRLQRAARRRRLHRAQHRLHRRRRRVPHPAGHPGSSGPRHAPGHGRQHPGRHPRAGRPRPGRPEAARRGGRDLLPGARRARALPRGMGLAAGRRGAGRRRLLVVVAGRRGRDLGGPDGWPAPRWRCSRWSWPRSPSRVSGRCWSRSARATPRCSTRGGPGWFRLAAVALVAAVVLLWYAALRRRMGPSAAGRRRADLAGGPRRGPRRLRAGRLLPGRLAGPRRGARRGPRAGDLLPRGAGGRGRSSGERSPSSSSRRPSRCSSRRSACPPAPPPAFVAAMLAVALLPAFELLFPDDEPPRTGRAGWPRRPCRSPPSSWPSPARASAWPSTASTPGTPCPASSSTRWTPTPVRPGGRAPRTSPGRTPPATSAAGARCPSTSPTWPARTWRPVPPSPRTSRRRWWRPSRTPSSGRTGRSPSGSPPQRTGVRLLAVELTVDGGTVTGGRVSGRAVAEAPWGRTGCG